MKYRVRFRAQAREEYLEALEWYADEGVDLAARFARAIDNVLESIADNPRKYVVVHRGIRRALAS